MNGHPVVPEGSLPRALAGATSPLLLAVGLLVAIEVTVFALLITSYLYLRLAHDTWPPAGFDVPELLLPTVSTAILVVSVMPAHVAARSVGTGNAPRLGGSFLVGLALVLAYPVLKWLEFAGKDFDWTPHVYASLEWTLGGYTVLHATTLLLLGGTTWVLGWKGHFNAKRYAGLQVTIVYWYFVALGSVPMYLTQYLVPRLT